MTTTVLVVEDNADLAFGLKTALEFDGYDVVVADDGPSGLDRARTLEPDMIVLDLMLPGMNGYQVLKAIRGDDLDVPVLILTARGEEADKVLGFNIGADDYVTKPFGTLEFLARVKALLRRSGHSPAGANTEGEPEQFGRIVVNPASRTVHRDGETVSLTPKAFDLLLALVRRRGAVASRVDLLRELWDYNAEVVTRTVDMHIAELRRKLEDDPAHPAHILTVRKVGYRLEA